METILAIDLGKRNSVFCRLNSRSLKPEYFTTKTDPQKFHDIFVELDTESSIGKEKGERKRKEKGKEKGSGFGFRGLSIDNLYLSM